MTVGPVGPIVMIKTVNTHFEGRTKVNDANLTESENLTDTQSLVVLNVTLLTLFVSYDENSNI